MPASPSRSRDEHASQKASEKPKQLTSEDELSKPNHMNKQQTIHGQEGEKAHTTLDLLDFLPLPPPFSLGTVKRILQALR